MINNRRTKDRGKVSAHPLKGRLEGGTPKIRENLSRVIGAQIIAAEWRRRGAAAGAIALVALLLLAQYVTDTRRTPLDARVDALVVRRPEWLDVALSRATELAGPVNVVLAGAIFGIVCCLLGEVRAASLVSGGPVSALLVTEVLLKPLVARPPVYGGEGHAFPSGHATAVFALGLAVILVLHRQGAVGRRVARVVRVLGLTLAMLIPAYLALALASFRHHYVTDILGGVAVAVLVVLIMALALDHVQKVPSRR